MGVGGAKIIIGGNLVYKDLGRITMGVRSKVRVTELGGPIMAYPAGPI